MDKGKFPWLIVIAVAVLSAFVVPYTLLRNVDAWYGSFLFYTIVGVLVIALNLWATRDFGKGDAP